MPAGCPERRDLCPSAADPPPVATDIGTPLPRALGVARGEALTGESGARAVSSAHGKGLADALDRRARADVRAGGELGDAHLLDQPLHVTASGGLGLQLVDRGHPLAVGGDAARQPFQPLRGRAQVALDVTQSREARPPRASRGRRAGPAGARRPPVRGPGRRSPGACRAARGRPLPPRGSAPSATSASSVVGRRFPRTCSRRAAKRLGVPGRSAAAVDERVERRVGRVLDRRIQRAVGRAREREGELGVRAGRSPSDAARER